MPKELDIHSLGAKGDGIAEDPQGRVYVERSAPGDRVLAHLNFDFQGIPRGEILEILTPSPWRQKPPCQFYDRCGNCSLQHVQESFYRDWKIQNVKDAFARHGIVPERWEPPIYVPGGGRRRVTFTALRMGGKVTLGYYRRRSQTITDISSCLVAQPELFALRETLKPLLKGILRESEPVDVFLQKVGGAMDLLLTGPVGRLDGVALALEPLLELSFISRVSWRPNDASAIQILVEVEPVVASFGPLRVALPPFAFLQPTLDGEKALVASILASLPQTGKLVDLFSGCGTFSGPMLEKGAVDAYESVAASVTALNQARGRHPLKVFQRDLFQNPVRGAELEAYGAVVFDPPRAGCPEQATALAASKVPVLVGVSCNPATFSRDAKILVQGGYQLKSLQVIDQFQWSHHVEMVGVFSR